MKPKLKYHLAFVLMILCATLSFTNLIAQEKSAKQLKEEAKQEKQKQTALLVDSKEFVFVAKMVNPQGGRTINLTSNDYTIEFHPDLIKSDLPFFGRAYSGAGYGGDNGMKFEGKPQAFSIKKTKKSHSIKVEVKGEHDFYSLSLDVYYDGSAYLSISSNNRSSISYNGDIEAFKKK